MLFGLKGKPVVFFYAALDMSCDSLGYERFALKANADGAAINFQLHRHIKSEARLPLTSAVAASAGDSAI